MNTHPEKWYIGVTEENRDELDRWRKKVATSHRSGTLEVGYTLLSKHHVDNSYYFAGPFQGVSQNDDYKDYQEITLEQFRQIINSTQKPMTLLEKCNADVFKAILDIKSERPEIGENLLAFLQKHQYWWQMNGEEILRFAAYLPYEIWDRKIHTFYLLFESKQATTIL